jgi:hypothetical protein
MAGPEKIVAALQQLTDDEEVEKMTMGIQQLEDALLRYYEERYHSAIVLAGAAEQLFAGYLHKHGEEPAFNSSRAASAGLANLILAEKGRAVTEKEMGDAINRPYNQSKHASSSDLVVKMNPKHDARHFIERAIQNFDACSALGYSNLPVIDLAQRFTTETLGTAPNARAEPE